jgi:hypothetical protein
MEEEGDPA